jgi:hypothetical protein
MGLSDPAPMSPSTKRKLLLESISAHPISSTEFDEPDPKRTKIIDSELPVSEKLDKVFDLFETLGWRTDVFLHHFFVKDKNNPRSHRHAVFHERVLNGKGEYLIAELLEAWWATTDRADDSDTMYSVTTSYTDMRGIRSALSSFAAQIIEVRLLQEAQVAVHETSGLHASVMSKTENGLVKWSDLGASLMTETRTTLQTYQPLTFHYMRAIAEPKPRKRKGEISVRNYRPPDLVSSVGLGFCGMFTQYFRLLHKLSLLSTLVAMEGLVWCQSPVVFFILRPVYPWTLLLATLELEPCQLSVPSRVPSKCFPIKKRLPFEHAPVTLRLSLLTAGKLQI